MTMIATHARNAERQIGEFIPHATCRFCESSRLERVLDFGNVPLAGGFLKPEQFTEERYYPLDLKFCIDCTLVQVANAVPGDVLFRNYFYFSSKIQTLVDHSVDFARDVYDRFLVGRSDPSVFEIGCNDGVMLRPLARLGVRAVGMDPASNVVASAQQDGFIILDDFFGRESAARVRQQFGSFDAITTSYSFAHIDDMRSVMDGVNAILKPDGVLVFEVYYLGTLMDEMQYDMIYHEHCSYYSLSALKHFLARYGMEVFDTHFTAGVRSGAVRFYARRIGKRPEPISDAVHQMDAYEAERGFGRVETFLHYGAKVAKTRADLVTLLDALRGEGKTIIGYGASGRGTTVMNYCGIDGKYLDYVVDDAPAKHGFATPGTHVPICPWARVEEGPRPDYALLFAWSFAREVVKKRAEYLRAGGKFIVPLPDVRVIGAEVLPPAVRSPSQQRTSVLVLGATGMLGSMLTHYLRERTSWEVLGTGRHDRSLVPFDARKDIATQLGSDVLSRVQYIVNCVGITKPYCHDDNQREVENAIAINAMLPHALAATARSYGIRVIQIATDCVYSGTRGGYDEDVVHDPCDVYGKTKSLGEVRAGGFLNIRCSIIGPESNKKAFLLEWFLQQQPHATLRGFTHHRWNGVTTLQFSELCRSIIASDAFDALAARSPVHHFTPNDVVTKHQLLEAFRDVYRLPVTISEHVSGAPMDRTLATKYRMLSDMFPAARMVDALDQLRMFTIETRFYERAAALDRASATRTPILV
ncbi:methyltransferase domain-containing protein [Candidatus Uhrbacteria bacterium]|nr:methyltransferase domain-containing protein [Candidatus Uhrbacteria bacterium]